MRKHATVTAKVVDASSTRRGVPSDVLARLACMAIQPENSIQEKKDRIQASESGHHPWSNVVGSDTERDIQRTNKTYDAAREVVNFKGVKRSRVSTNLRMKSQ